MLHVLVLHSFLQIQTDFQPSTVVFDYQSPISGRIMLQDCFAQTVETEIVYPARNLSWNRYKHVIWELPSYCGNYTISMDADLDRTLKLQNGWAYQKDTIFHQGLSYYLEFLNGQWFVYNSTVIGQRFFQSPFRLKYHFSAIQGWINDPNGLVYNEGLWHLFYQFNPYSAHWGNMHWGHAVSRDLMFWQHLPIALYPNPELNARFIGGAFSGSAIFHNGNFWLAYTDHLEDKMDPRNIFIEKQKLVSSADSLNYGKSMTAINRQPQGATKNFRDPKIWFDSSRNTFFMVVGSKMQGYPSVLLYSSAEGVIWAYVGIAYQEKMINSVTIECPDLFPLGDRYVLIFNTYENAFYENHQILYLVGDFNGKVFTSENKPQRLDFGNYFYAMQTYNNAPYNERIGIGWMNSWDDLSDYKDRNSFAGAMAIPRHLELLNSTTIGMTPVASYQNYRSSPMPFFSQNGFRFGRQLISTNNPHIEIQISSATPTNGWNLIIHPSQYNMNDAVFVQWVPSANKIILMNRLNKNVTFVSPPITSMNLNVTILLDVTSVEVFINHGQATGTMRFVPPHISTGKVYLVSTGNPTSNDLSVKLWKLVSIWSVEPPNISTASPYPVSSSSVAIFQKFLAAHQTFTSFLLLQLLVFVHLYFILSE